MLPAVLHSPSSRSRSASGTLMIRGGAVGDFVVTLPLLAALRKQFPRERCAVLAQPGIAPLALAAGLVDEARSLEAAALAAFFAPAARPLPMEWAGWFAGFARVITFLHDPSGTFAANLARAGAAAPVAGPARSLPGGGLAAQQLAAPVIAALGLPPLRPATFRLRLGEAARAAAKDWLGAIPLLALHPGSGSPRKNWPAERWVELGRAVLAAQPGRLLVLGGEADAAPLAALRAALPPGRALFVENEPLPRVAALLASSPLFLGHDSGLGHLAAAVGTPSVLLFGGASDPAVWGPPQPGARILQAPGGDLSRLEVVAVLAALRGRLLSRV